MDEDQGDAGGKSDPERTRSMAPGASTSGAGAAIPARIGRYSILRVLGEGGMGTVYEAEQDQPKRAVALKVIRSGSLSPQLLKRFEYESQVLGRLQHPGIAQVYEAGTMEDERGRPVPFFAMEFIRGVALTEYAASKNLGTRERLELVARICDAVYHAHQKGVIHRDLKPGNILVDESGQPKILDFGVARATDSDLHRTTMQTDIGQLIGTVPYMSPEQVGGDPDELDTRSDVYALGVVAYELLSGRLPYDLTRRVVHEAARIIREEEPTRLSSIDRALRGDVETIIAKSLEKDKVRRYQSAESLASDIRRYLKDEPIAARPASTWYQVRKFSRRHRTLVLGVIASFVVLLAGLGTTLWQAQVAREQRDAAIEARRRAEESEAFITCARFEPGEGTVTFFKTLTPAALRHMNRLASVRHLRIEEAAGWDHQTIGLLTAEGSGVASLSTVILSGYAFNDFDVQALAANSAAFGSVTALWLAGTQVTDKGVAAIASSGSAFSALNTLDLGFTRVTDAGVIGLAAQGSRLGALTTLYLYGNKVTDVGVTALTAKGAALSALTTLDLRGTQVTDAGVAALAAKGSALSGLKTLNLYGTQVSDVGVAGLAASGSALSTLTNLDLGYTQVTDTGMAAVAARDSALSGLRTLKLRGTQVGDAGVAALAAEGSALAALTT
ncbi:MAG: protein kinase, partial [Planctomycetota bacterium]